MRKKLFWILKWLCFITIVFVVLFKFSKNFVNYKGQDYNYKLFFEMEEVPDVCFFGSSIAGNAFETNRLFDEYQIKAYNLSSTSQHIDTTYYVMDKVMKYKKPKVAVVVLDYMNMLCDSKTLNNEIISTRNVRASKSEEIDFLHEHFDGNLIEYMKYYMPILQFHDDMIKDTMQHDNYEEEMVKRIYQKGFSYQEGCEPIIINGLAAEQKDISDEYLKYLKKIEKLCEDNQVQLIYVILPVEKEMEYVQSIKQNVDVNVIDYYDVMESISLDSNKDYINDQHVNLNGAEKITSYMGEYIYYNYNSILSDYDKTADDIWNDTIDIYHQLKYDKYDWKQVSQYLRGKSGRNWDEFYRF